LTLVISLDAAGQARGDLYEDKGEGFGYRDGEYLRTTYQAARSDGMVEVSVAREEGHLPRPVRKLHVELLTTAGVLHASGTDGKPVRLQLP
jgi:hypothetical protein